MRGCAGRPSGQLEAVAWFHSIKKRCPLPATTCSRFKNGDAAFNLDCIEVNASGSRPRSSLGTGRSAKRRCEGTRKAGLRPRVAPHCAVFRPVLALQHAGGDRKRQRRIDGAGSGIKLGGDVIAREYLRGVRVYVVNHAPHQVVFGNSARGVQGIAGHDEMPFGVSSVREPTAVGGQYAKPANPALRGHRRGRSAASRSLGLGRHRPLAWKRAALNRNKEARWEVGNDIPRCALNQLQSQGRPTTLRNRFA